MVVSNAYKFIILMLAFIGNNGSYENSGNYKQLTKIENGVETMATQNDPVFNSRIDALLREFLELLDATDTTTGRIILQPSLYRKQKTH